MKLTLYNINTKLYELDERFGELYPKYMMIHDEFINKTDEALMASQGFATQQLRDAATRQIVHKDVQYPQYLALQTEIELLRTRMRNLQQISRNLVSNNWYTEGGEQHGR